MGSMSTELIPSHCYRQTEGSAQLPAGHSSTHCTHHCPEAPTPTAFSHKHPLHCSHPPRFCLCASLRDFWLFFNTRFIYSSNPCQTQFLIERDASESIAKGQLSVALLTHPEYTSLYGPNRLPAIAAPPTRRPFST